MSSPASRVRLVCLHVSPWTERAKWALDHHRVDYEVVEHLPIVGERRLRKLVGPEKPRATVPVLLADGAVLSESWDIARWADGEGIGQGTKLFSGEHEVAIRKWATVADDAMNAGRAIIVSRTIASDGSLDENAPPFVPRWARPLVRPLTRNAMRAFGRKYEVGDDHEGPKRAMRAAMLELRAALGGRPFILGSFTYADVAMATLLQGVSPVANQYLRLGEATRAVWTNEELAREFADLVSWRDATYAAHRNKRKRAKA